MVSEISIATDIFFCHFGLFFALLPSWQPGKYLFLKNEKNTWKYHLIQVHQKTWSYALLFFRDCSSLSYFFALLPLPRPLTPNSPKFKISKKTKTKKKCLETHYFTQLHQKSWSYTILFLRYGTRRMQFLFFILDYFLPFYPFTILTAWKMKISKNEKVTEYIIVLHKCPRNLDHMLILFVRYSTWHT